MSEAAVSQFFDQLKKNKALVNDYNSAVASALRSVVWPAMVDVAAVHGYEFTKEELGRYLESKVGELSEQELESISAAGPSGIPVALDDGDDDSPSP
jgi:stalled ribosome rescue protein Dom34